MKPNTGSTTIVTLDHKPSLERLGPLSFGFGTNDTNLAAAGLLGDDPSTD